MGAASLSPGRRRGDECHLQDETAFPVEVGTGSWILCYHTGTRGGALEASLRGHCPLLASAVKAEGTLRAVSMPRRASARSSAVGVPGWALWLCYLIPCNPLSPAGSVCFLTGPRGLARTMGGVNWGYCSQCVHGLPHLLMAAAERMCLVVTLPLAPVPSWEGRPEASCPLATVSMTVRGGIRSSVCFPFIRACAHLCLLDTGRGPPSLALVYGLVFAATISRLQRPAGTFAACWRGGPLVGYG